MRLEIEKEFSIEVGKDSYSGVFKDLTKKQQKTIFKKFDLEKKQEKELRKLRKTYSKNERLIKLYESNKELEKAISLEDKNDAISENIEKIFDKLNDDDAIEDMFKSRLELSIFGNDKEDILKIGLNYGYERVYETITRDIREKNEKK